MKLKNFSSSAVAALTIASALISATALADNAQAETFSINNKALNTNGVFSRIDGQPRVTIWDAVPNDPDQDFQRLSGNRSGVLLKNQKTGNCVNAYRKFNGAEFNTWPCNPNDPDQNWQINSLGSNIVQIKLAGTNSCIDTPTRTNGGKVHLWTCDSNNSNQRFQSSNVIPPGNISLPFGRNQTWYVCQGYNGTVSHQNSFSLDLSVAPDFGSRNACWANDGNVNKSAGRDIFAPANGIVRHVNSDLVCLDLDKGRSLMIGHIDRTVANNQRVTKDALLGKLSRAASKNGGFAHIHLEGRAGKGCTGGSVPLTVQYNLQLEGIGDLPGGETHFRKSLTRK